MEIQIYKTFWWHLNLIILSLLLTSVLSLEENQPEIFLTPRNFNPHPYERRYDYQSDTNKVGPVVFPPSPSEDSSVDNNIGRVSNEPNLGHPIDNHPYARVARKRKYKFPSRFTPEELNEINPRVYEALSNHAAKVLTAPLSQLRKDYILSSQNKQNKNYAFSYKVIDHLTGDDFSHTQSQNSRATNGEYRVKLPDGRLQIVSYTADKNGYKADVKYTEEQTINNKINQYNYQISPQQLTTNKILYTPTKPTENNYQTYLVSATAKPVLTPKSSVYFSTGTVQPKVEIYSHNNGINGLENYVVSTVAPFLVENTAKTYHEDYVGSTVAPSLATYTSVYTIY